MTEDEKAAKFASEVKDLSKTAEKKGHKKEVKKYVEAIEKCKEDGENCPKYEKKLKAAVDEVKKDDAEDYEKKVEEEKEEKAKVVNSVDVVEATKKVETFKKEIVEVEKTIAAKVADPPKEPIIMPGTDSNVKEKVAKDKAEEEAKEDAVEAEKEVAAAAVKKNPAVAAAEAAAENFDAKKKIEAEAEADKK
jgi:hypothetical protein